MQNELDNLRECIRTIDDKIVLLLAERMQISRAIGEYKHKNHIEIINNGVYHENLKRLTALGVDSQLSTTFIEQIFDTIHKESISSQKR